MSRSRLIHALALLACGACHCGPPTTSKLQPSFVANPNTLSFDACPVVDANGNPIPGAEPDVQSFTLSNVGKVDGTPQVSISGVNASVFAVDAGSVPPALSAGASATIAVEFFPTGAGVSSATLNVGDGADGGVTVALVGTGSNLPAQPTLEIIGLSGTDGGCVPRNYCPFPQVLFPDTFYGQSATLHVQIASAGCPALSITSAGMTNTTTGDLGYYLDAPSPLPTTSNPISVTSTPLDFAIRFAPQQDSTGNDSRLAILNIGSSDPSFDGGLFQVLLNGNALIPSLSISPTACDFTLPSDACGGTKNDAGTLATFTLVNTGTAILNIDSVSFEKMGQGGRFTIGPRNPQGMPLAVGGMLPVDVTYTDAPVFVSDRLFVAASATGMAAGTAIVDLSGGILPQLQTIPDTSLIFQNADAGLNAQPLVIRDATGAGTLIINRVFVDANPFFSIQSGLDAGASIAPGGSTTVQVAYNRPISGGQQSALLHVDSNDPGYPAPQYKAITLWSNTPLNQLPVAILEGVDTQGMLHRGSMTVSLQTLMTSPKQLTVTGRDSYHPLPDGGTEPVAQFLFLLARKPSGSTASLQNSGNQTTLQDAILSMSDAGAQPLTGQYVVTLTVYDTTGQPSGTPDALTLDILQ